MGKVPDFYLSILSVNVDLCFSESVPWSLIECKFAANVLFSLKEMVIVDACYFVDFSRTVNFLVDKLYLGLKVIVNSLLLFSLL